MIMYGFFFLGCLQLLTAADLLCSETVTDKRARTIKEVKEILNRSG